MTSLRRLEFSAYCHTQYGEYVCICGNIPELGNWNPLRGLRLHTQEAFYPVWKSFAPILVIENQPVEFKILIVTSRLEFKWENITQNRIITPEIDAYVKIRANEFQIYEIFPFSMGDDAGVRAGFDILNDLQSDGSSSISFKSNYKFYEYYRRKHQNSHQNSMAPQNTSTFRDLSQFDGQRPRQRSQNQFVTYFDSLTQLEHGQTGKDVTTQDCSNNKCEQQSSCSVSSDRIQMDEQWAKPTQTAYTGGTDFNLGKTQKGSDKKSKLEQTNIRLTSLSKIVYSSSSQFLHQCRDQ